MRILLVDDETDANDLTSFILTGEGAEVVTASSAKQAMELLSPKDASAEASAAAAAAAAAVAPVDMIISDIGMPENDGLEFIRLLRTNEPTKCVPVIALTAYAGERDRRQIIDAGFLAHLSKPLDPAELVTEIKSTGGRGRQRGSGSSSSSSHSGSGTLLNVDRQREVAWIWETVGAMPDFSRICISVTRQFS